MIDNNKKYLSDLVVGHDLAVADETDLKKFKSNALKELNSTSPEQNELVSEFLSCYLTLRDICNDKLRYFDVDGNGVTRDAPAGYVLTKVLGTFGSVLSGIMFGFYLHGGQHIDGLVSAISGVGVAGSGTFLVNYLPQKIINASFESDVKRLIEAYASRMDRIDLISLDKQVNEQFLLLEKKNKKKDLKC